MADQAAGVRRRITLRADPTSPPWRNRRYRRNLSRRTASMVGVSGSSNTIPLVSAIAAIGTPSRCARSAWPDELGRLADPASRDRAIASHGVAARVVRAWVSIGEPPLGQGWIWPRSRLADVR